jgi:hypothetical protein
MIISELGARGIMLRVIDGKPVFYRAAGGEIAPADKVYIRSHRDEILTELELRSNAPDPWAKDKKRPGKLRHKGFCMACGSLVDLTPAGMHMQYRCEKCGHYGSVMAEWVVPE